MTITLTDEEKLNGKMIDLGLVDKKGVKIYLELVIADATHETSKAFVCLVKNGKHHGAYGGVVGYIKDMNDADSVINKAIASKMKSKAYTKA